MTEISIKMVCCTCLSTNRKLNQLCRIYDGVNLLYLLLTHDPDAYKEGFYKDTASLQVCWECSAMLLRIKQFQLQACIAQKQLTAIGDGRNDVKLKSLSHLTFANITNPYFEYQHNDTIENFIDCGGIKEIEAESEDDLPLSSFNHKNNYMDIYRKFDTEIENDNTDPEIGSTDIKICKFDLGIGNTDTEISNTDMKICKPDTEIDNTDMKISNNVKLKKVKSKTTNLIKPTTKMKYKKYFSINIMNEDEMQNVMNVQRKNLNESDVLRKCEPCVTVFKTENDMSDHIRQFHEEKDHSTHCEICNSYVEDLHTHKQTHYYKYKCAFCVYITYTHNDIVKHLKKCHKEIGKRKKDSKRPQNGLIKDDLAKYPCRECDECFQDKDVRWRHIQKTHKEGYKCKSCDKKFAFKNNLERHERVHAGPLPRQQCPMCNKMIRVDLIRAHTLTHTERQTHTCVECDKTFVSRATYESHLKLARAHAADDARRYKCPSCQRSYRTRAELQDHINYYHNGQAMHKCPVCGKGLATKRCIRRHVRRAHEGIKENAKDKICQQCGKAFRDKKSLYEHERIHSGARPLSCASCGRAFRQRSALYAHVKRMHRAN